MSDMSKYVEIINTACEEILACGKLLSIKHVYRKLLECYNQDPEDSVLLALRDVCAYGQDSNTGAFIPMMEWFIDNQQQHKKEQKCEVYPTPLENINIDDSKLSVWSTLASNDDMHSLVRARLADLLWYVKNKNAKWHLIAIEEYTKFSKSEQVEEYERGCGLTRAIDLIIRTNQSKKIEPTYDLVLTYAREMLAINDWIPGCISRAVYIPLKYGKCDFGWFEVLLNEIEIKYWLYTFKDLVSLKDANKIFKEELAKRIISECINAANSTNASVDASNFFKNEALNIARQAGIEDSLEVSLSDREIFKDARPNYYLAVPQSSIQKLVEDIVDDGILKNVMRRFAALYPAPGNILSENKIAVIQRHFWSIRKADDSFSMPSMPHTPLSKGLDSSDIKSSYYNQPNERINVYLFAQNIGIPVLRHLSTLKPKYSTGEPIMFSTQDELIELYAKRYGMQVAKYVANSFGHWQKSEHNEASIILLPFLENMIRAECSKLGVRISRKPSDPRKSPHLSMKELITNIKKIDGVNRGVYRYMEAVLVDHEFLNIRNDILHGRLPPEEGWYTNRDTGDYLDFFDGGIMPSAEETYALLFHIACILYSSTEISEQTMPSTAR